MSNGTDCERPPDTTTAAIYETIRTMGGGDGAASETPAPYSLAVVASPNRINKEVENDLVKEGVFVKRGAVQQIVLGCIACRLGSANQEDTGLTVPQVTACADKEPMGVRRVLKRLADAGILESRTEDGDGNKLRAPIYGLTSSDAAAELKENLQKPEQCGLKVPRKKLNAAAEDELVEMGILGNRTDASRSILGCLACRWQAGTGIHGLGVEQCTGVNNTTAFSMLKTLERAGIVDATVQDRSTVGKKRICYTPAETVLGKRIAWLLEMPEHCGLEQRNANEEG